MVCKSYIVKVAEFGHWLDCQRRQFNYAILIELIKSGIIVFNKMISQCGAKIFVVNVDHHRLLCSSLQNHGQGQSQ